LVVVETGIRFRAPARFDDELEITLHVERLGNTSMVSAIGIWRVVEQTSSMRALAVGALIGCSGKACDDGLLTCASRRPTV
jgi:acyl-CoA thioesterase FadM